MIDVKPLITHTFPLSGIRESILDYMEDKEKGIKAMMVDPCAETCIMKKESINIH